MTDASQPQTDNEHLRLLSIFHYVLGSMNAVFACVPFIHLFIGLALFFNPDAMSNGQAPPAPAWFGLIFVGIAATAIVFGWTLAILTLLNGRFIAKRRHRVFCLIVAGVECMMMPLGTILGVFTIIVLLRDSVKAQFDESQVPD